MTVPHAVETFSTNPNSSSPLLPAVICSAAALPLLRRRLLLLLPSAVPTSIVDDNDAGRLTRCFRFDMGRPIPAKAWLWAIIEKTTTRAKKSPSPRLEAFIPVV